MLTSDLGPGLATLETLVHQQVWESGAKWETINSLSVCSRIFCLQVCCGLSVTHWCVVGAITAYEAFSCATLAVCSGLKRRIGGVLVGGGGRGWEPSTKQHTPSLLHQCVTSSFHSIRQCAPFFVLSSTRWHTLSLLLYPTKRHTPSLHFSTRWKTSPCGAHFSLTLLPIIWSVWGHSSGCDGSLHYWKTRPGAFPIYYANCCTPAIGMGLKQACGRGKETLWSRGLILWVSIVEGCPLKQGFTVWQARSHNNCVHTETQMYHNWQVLSSLI